MPLHPGIVRVAPRLPEGEGRLLFRGLASLQPGSLACGADGEGFLLFHCLDTRDDVEGALSRAQDELVKLWGEEQE
jgi:multisubunit Na+/H+ antiporter MnhE subunit